MPDGPTALVTGGARRVGSAIVERLAAAGFNVRFTYHGSHSEAAALVADVRRRWNTPIDAVAADLASPGSAERLAAVVHANGLGRLDLLVNNASLYLPDDAPAGASAGLQERLFAVNAVAPAALTAALAPALTAARGSVVNFLDLLAEKPWPKYSAYCASKAALQSITLSYARKLAPHVRVNGIAPGVIDWPAEMAEADRAAYLKKVPLARAGTPGEAADVVHWLATNAPYVTGQVIRLDGGRSLV